VLSFVTMEIYQSPSINYYKIPSTLKENNHPTRVISFHSSLPVPVREEKSYHTGMVCCHYRVRILSPSFKMNDWGILITHWTKKGNSA
jgi:hypothetical protein